MNTWYYFTAGDKYIGVDRDSGGYPAYTDNPNAICFWNSPIAAVEYRNKFLSSTDSSMDWILKSIDF